MEWKLKTTKVKPQIRKKKFKSQNPKNLPSPFARRNLEKNQNQNLKKINEEIKDNENKIIKINKLPEIEKEIKELSLKIKKQQNEFKEIGKSIKKIENLINELNNKYLAIKDEIYKLHTERQTTLSNWKLEIEEYGIFGTHQ